MNDALQRRNETAPEPQASATTRAAPALPAVSAPSRATQLEYEAILANASIGIALTRERRFFVCNPRFAEMFGWSREELLGQSGELIYPSPESFESLGVIAVPILAAGGRLDVEWELRRRDGNRILCRVVAKAIDPQQTQQGTVWIIEDITAQRRQDAELEQVLREQHMIFDNATVGISFVRQRVYQRCNRRLEAMFGFAPGELLGKQTRVTYPGCDAYESAGRRIYAALAAPDGYTSELQFQRKDGSLFWCKLIGRAIDPLRPDEGSIWIYDDVSDEHAARAALAASNDELERKVEKRTRELTERTNELSLALQKLEQEVGERRIAEERARHLADHDPLTNLPNRRLLEDRLSQALALNRRNRGHAAVMYVDLDRFKAVNDAHGHSVGDALLKEVAARLVGQLRDVDTICRIGGDEFIVVLPELKRPADAAGVAQKLIDRLAEPVSVGGLELEVSSSAGISVFPEDGTDAETLIRNADAALYYAKDSGRACYKFFTEEMNATASHRVTLEAELRCAPANGELRLHFQPVVELASGIGMGHEALLRWRHPSRGLLEPGEFLGATSDAALLAQIDEWVLREACRQAARRPGAGFVAVNVSLRQFSDSRLVDQLARALREAELPPGRLEIEISESIAMRQPDVAAALLAKIAALGVGVVLDRFGSAQSSLSSLRRFPLWRLKVDRSIISQLPGSRENRDIVAASVGIGRALGIAIGAVGVESEAQRAVLADCGCEFIQGTLSGAPIEWT